MFGCFSAFSPLICDILVIITAVWCNSDWSHRKISIARMSSVIIRQPFGLRSIGQCLISKFHQSFKLLVTAAARCDKDRPQADDQRKKKTWEICYQVQNVKVIMIATKLIHVTAPIEYKAFWVWVRFGRSLIFQLHLFALNNDV